MNRIDWIDELKGFILLLVCLGHTGIRLGNQDIDILTISTAFRMSTFFFLSGLLFSVRRYPTIKSYTKSKTKTLLVPYLLLSLLFTFLDPRLYDISLLQFNKEIAASFQLQKIQSSLNYLCMELGCIVWDCHSTPMTGPLWFVYTLFVVSVLFYIVHYHAKGNKYIISLYACICLATGWICNIHQCELPLKLATIMSASFFFSLGYLTKKLIISLHSTPPPQRKIFT